MDYTLTIIKPHAVRENKAVKILSLLTEAGFRISAMKMMRLSTYRAGEFYAEHEGKFFCEQLVEMMSSGPIIVAVLEKENAISELRQMVGNTDPEKAEPGTIRKLFGKSVRENAIHASDGRDNAIRETSFFFSGLERFSL
jgi:nucleoside-diphosphate kinase